jgi:hypothetical protein
MVKLKVNVNVKLSSALNEHHAIKTYWRSGGIAPRIVWPRHYMEVSGQLDAPATLPPQERAPRTLWIGGLVGTRAGVDTVSKRKTPSPRRKANPDHPIVQPVPSRYTDWAIPVLTKRHFSYV